MMIQQLGNSLNANSWEVPSAGHKFIGNTQWGPDPLISQNIRAIYLTFLVPESV